MKYSGIICDICKRKIPDNEDSGVVRFLPITLLKQDEFDVCRSCGNKIRKYIKILQLGE